MKKIVILILTSLAITSCSVNEAQEKKNSDFLEKYSCVENTDSSLYSCEKLGDLSLSKTLFKVYNDKYFKDKNAIYKINENNNANMLNIEIRKINDIESAYDLDEDSFEILSDENTTNEYIKDINGIYKLYNYQNDPIKKVNATINDKGLVELTK